MAPTIEPTKSRNLSWRTAGPRIGRRTVDRRKQHVPHVGPFERERPTSTPRSQPERHHDGDDDRQPVRTVGSDLRDLCGRELTVADEAGTDEDGDATEDRRQVRLVERIDPVDVRQPLAAPDAPPLE